MIKKLVIVLFISIIGLGAYSALVLHQAKSYTEKVVLPDLKAGMWRLQDGSPRVLTIRANDLSASQKQWLYAIQDPNFESHNGMDLSTPGAGLTTITQSMVKKLFFNKFKKGLAKYKQTLIAVFVVDDAIGKNDQLEIFLNSVYMGSVEDKPIYGFNDASRNYFKKDFSTLSDDEYLSLVAMLIAPNTYHVINDAEKNRDRVSRLKKVISGDYKPENLMDVYYDNA